MGRNKNKNIRKLTKIGKSSYCVTLPMDTVREFGWREKQRLKIEVDKKQQEIIIRDWGR
ncbi:MAG: AbrB/MazE/SpoVT family DNA-binding domain-containing protein [Candidatus Omnitrophota bacterium]